MPALCELLGIPYTGCDSATLALALDKALAKRILRAARHPHARVPGARRPAARSSSRRFSYPVIVKPNAEGISKGIAVDRRRRRRGRRCAPRSRSSSRSTGSRRWSRSTSPGASSPSASSARSGRACCRRWRSCFKDKSTRRARSTTSRSSRTGRSTSSTSARRKLTPAELKAVEQAARETFAGARLPRRGARRSAHGRTRARSTCSRSTRCPG